MNQVKFVSHTYMFLRKYCTWQVDRFLTQQSSASINIREDPKQTERNFCTLELLLNHGYEYSEDRAALLPPLTAMNPEVFLQMVFVFEGLATLGAFELAVAGRLVEQLVL